MRRLKTTDVLVASAEWEALRSSCATLGEAPRSEKSRLKSKFAAAACCLSLLPLSLVLPHGSEEILSAV